MSLKSKDVSLISEIEQILSSEDYSLYGFSIFDKPSTIALYKEWLNQKYHGEMAYLEEHLQAKENPATYYPMAKNAIIVAVNYRPHPKPTPLNESNLRIAEYAKGEDYHFWLKTKLLQTVQKLKLKFPNEEFLVATDSAPILERDLAKKAGLGWVGKNTCLIHPKKGSLFLIGEILTTLSLESTLAPIHDFCGTCTKCIEICPTEALIHPRTLDATKCISYLTIESRKVPPPELREKIGDWFFGCDLCQTTCPWNQKVFQNTLEVSKTRSYTDETKQNIIEEFRFILTSSGKKIEQKFRGTPLKRAGPFGLRRNALVVIGNLKLKELKSEVLLFVNDEKLSELANWCLKKLET